MGVFSFDAPPVARFVAFPWPLAAGKGKVAAIGGGAEETPGV